MVIDVSSSKGHHTHSSLASLDTHTTEFLQLDGVVNEVVNLLMHQTVVLVCADVHIHLGEDHHQCQLGWADAGATSIACQYLQPHLEIRQRNSRFKDLGQPESLRRVLEDVVEQPNEG